MGNTSFFRIAPQRTELVAEAGRWGLYKTVYTMEKVPDEGNESNVIQTSYQSLLPPLSQDKYISIHDAHKRTGISEMELNALCDRGVIKAKKVGKGWIVYWESLYHYIKQNS